MSALTPELTQDWLAFARASLQTRIDDTEQATRKVLNAIQSISEQLDDSNGVDKKQLESLLAMDNEHVLAREVLPVLENVLRHLEEKAELAQLIGPLYTALQFEDRTRQKIEGLLDIMAIWADVRLDETISDKALADRLMQPVVSPEQQSILAKYFPEYIQVAQADDEIEFF